MTFTNLSIILYENYKKEYMSFLNSNSETIKPFDGHKKIIDVFTNVKSV